MIAVTDNSRDVEKGSVFVAVRGPHNDGHDFIGEAIRRGASAVVMERSFRGKIKKSGPVSMSGRYICEKSTSNTAWAIYVDDTKASLARLARYFYKDPSRAVKVIGITGTNGKTTVAHLLKHVLETAGFSAGIIGTIFHGWKDKKVDSRNTTPGLLELQYLLGRMRNDRVDYAVMEVSSHSLKQDRIRGITFRSAVFTNISREHLDYHRTMKDYAKAKERLFTDYLRSGAHAVINKDSDFFKKVAPKTKAAVVGYGIDNPACVTARNLDLGMNMTRFSICAKDGSADITSRLVGMFNVYNILACAGAALSEGIPLSVIKKGIETFKGVEGRLEAVDAGQNFKVFVDYAHTDDALEKVLGALRGLAKRRIITLFGCGGNRDAGKRPRMGRVASELSDFVFVTQDNSRDEDPAEITRQISSGMKEGFDRFEIVLDREEAIKSALGMAKEGDIVLIAGKGHERYQISKAGKAPFCDKKVAMEWLKKY